MSTAAQILRRRACLSQLLGVPGLSNAARGLPLRSALLAGAALLATAGCSASSGGAHGAHGAPAVATRPGAPADARTSHEERHAAALLERLVAARGVSGREGPVRDAVVAELRRIDPAWQPRTDDAGNLWLWLGGTDDGTGPGGAGGAEGAAGAGGGAGGAGGSAGGAAPVVFIAHLDEIGVVVKTVRADGLLECKSLGGFHDHLYRGTAIELVTASGAVVPGIALPAVAGAAAASAPPAGGIVPAAGPYLLDVGAHDAAGIAALGIAVGDTATVPKELLRLGSHRVAGRSNDDRVGCASLLLALESLAATHGGTRLQRPALFIWSTREEIGLEGADAAARALRPVPSTVYAVDTFVTSDSPREDPHYAYARLGGGPVLRALDNSSITPPEALDAVRAIAARSGVTLQLGTMGGGNDGSRFVPEGATDCPLAWPQRNSHSRVETLDLRDLLALSRLVEALAREG